MNWFRWFWIVWLSVGLLVEGIALVRAVPGDTLSEHVWALRGSGFFSLIIFFLLWLIYHFLMEGR